MKSIEDFDGIRTRREDFIERHKGRIKRIPVTVAHKAVALGLYKNTRGFMTAVGIRKIF